jgi:serine/threonine protein kinase
VAFNLKETVHSNPSMISDSPPRGTPVPAVFRSPWELPAGVSEPDAASLFRDPRLIAGEPGSALGPSNHQASVQPTPRYEIISTIQRGGMGELVLAELTREDGTQAKVVIKRLLSSLVSEASYVSMFASEAKLMASLEHPNIVRVYDVPIIDGKQCLAMEYIHGRNLRQILRKCQVLDRKIPRGFVLAIGLEVLKGLAYAHRHVQADGRPLDLVHRDVTPGNLLVGFDGAVKITDFGIAKSNLSEVRTRIGVVKGTTRYLSPEQIRGDVATPRTDLFALGNVLVEMLTGEPVFDRGSVPATLFAIAAGDRPPVSSLLPFFAPRLTATLERAMALHPDGRFPDAEAFSSALMESAHEVGGLRTQVELGTFLRALFEETSDLFDPSKKDRIESLDLNDVFELYGPVSLRSNELQGTDDVPKPGSDPQNALGRKGGAAPLDASQFSEEGGVAGRAPPKGEDATANVVDSLQVLTAPNAPQRDSRFFEVLHAMENGFSLERLRLKGQPWTFCLGMGCGALVMWLVMSLAV